MQGKEHRNVQGVGGGFRRPGTGYKRVVLKHELEEGSKRGCGGVCGMCAGKWAQGVCCELREVRKEDVGFVCVSEWSGCREAMA